MVAQARVLAEGSVRNRVVRTYVEVKLTGLPTGKEEAREKSGQLRSFWWWCHLLIC